MTRMVKTHYGKNERNYEMKKNYCDTNSIGRSKKYAV